MSTQNVDTGEVSKFEALADTWWDPQGDMAPLHAINPLRVDYITRGFGSEGMHGLSALDVGCGGGLVAEALAQAGATVTGIDMAEASIEVARAHAADSGLDIEYRVCPAETLADERPAQYDLVTCLEMLEHVPDPAAVVAACAQLVKPGGHHLDPTAVEPDHAVDEGELERDGTADERVEIAGV